MTANVQDPDRKKSRSYAGIISGKDRPPPDLFLPGRTALNIPTLSVNVVDSDLPISIFEPRELNDVVEDEDLPSPYVDESLSSEEAPAEFPVDDVGSSRKLRPLTDPAKFLAALEDPDGRTTAALYEITENAANVLKEWQDEWMEIENRVARATQAKPRDPRAPIDPVTYEDQKEAALYGFRWDPHPAKRGNQDPFTQKRGLVVGGKELRRRDESSRRWGLESDDAAAQEPGSRGRPRRARMGGLLGQNDAAGSGIDTGRSSRAPTASTVRATGTPELTVPKKRGRPRLNNLPTRVNDLRAAPSGASTETEASASLATPAPAKRRGRPPKHLAAARGGAPAKRGRKRKTGEISSSGPPHRDGEEPKQRVKSAKRSAAMQLWWNTRKGLAGGKKDGGEERAGSGLEAAESGATARQETPLGPSPEAPAPRRKGRPPGKKGRRGVEGLKSERVVDSAADESDARSTPRPGAGAEPHGDGLTEFERFQKLSSGGGVGLGPGRRRRGWVGAVDEGARDAGEVDEEDEEGEDEEGDEVEEEFHVDDGTSWDEY
ncbi:MAG: hypothetical protein M1832_004991 [Thelocarpon impressellum]|nr:MAG: hypothetical protein M1832_004991 [Thelocarpon impressellum]